MLAFRTASIEKKASEIKVASSVETVTALAEKYFQELVEQRKELSKEKEGLLAERRELLQTPGGGKVLWSLILLALQSILFIACLAFCTTLIACLDFCTTCRSNCQRSR